MSYTLKLGTFKKYVESTAQPNTASWAQYDIVFKDGTDVVNPTVTLSIDYTTVKAYNYAYMLNRYYWIVQKTMLRNDYCELKLETDVMATYKSDIGSSSLYILRSSASYNGYIRDNYYPPTANKTTYYERQDLNSVPGSYNDGYYVLNIAGTGTSGNSTLYQFTPTNFKQLMVELYNSIDGFTVNDVINNVVKNFGGNPLKLINGAMWFPFPFSTVTSLSNTYIGNWYPGKSGLGNPVPCERIDDPYEELDFITLTVNKHPQASSRGQYLNLAPYSNYTLFVPGAGAVQLDTTKLIGASSISVSRMTDAFSGQMLVVVGANAQTLAVLTGQWGVPLSLSGNAPENILTGAINTIGNALSGGVTGILGAATAGINTIENAISGAAVSTGSGGSGLNIYQRPVEIQGIFFNVTNEDNTHNGRPYCQVTTPASLGGFMIAQRGDVDIDGTLPEEEKIKAFLESGFYYE